MVDMLLLVAVSNTIWRFPSSFYYSNNSTFACVGQNIRVLADVTTICKSLSLSVLVVSSEDAFYICKYCFHVV